MQIEKFIETIFPSQTAEQAKGQLSEAEEKAAQEKKDARSETMFIMVIMLIIVAFIASIMVCA